MRISKEVKILGNIKKINENEIEIDINGIIYVIEKNQKRYNVTNVKNEILKNNINYCNLIWGFDTQKELAEKIKKDIMYLNDLSGEIEIGENDFQRKAIKEVEKIFDEYRINKILSLKVACISQIKENNYIDVVVNKRHIYRIYENKKSFNFYSEYPKYDIARENCIIL